jgi:ribosomal protein L25 (general stress protein Ctc)
MRNENSAVVRRRLASAALALAAVAAAGAPGVAAAATPVAQIRANWMAFFSSKTAPARKIALLQDGAKFAAIIRAQAKSPLNIAVSAKVLNVKVRTKTAATVRYTIEIAGKPVLKNQTGTAVLQGKVWKVGDGSFCALLGLEGKRPAACPKPAAAK